MEKIVQENLEQIKQLFVKYGAKKAYLFGSAANNTCHDNSDIDFLFQFPTEMHYETYANNYFDLLYDLQNLHQRDVDLVAEKTLQNPYLLESINKNRIQLL